LQGFIAYFLNGYQLPGRVSLFKRSLYVLLFIQCLYYLQNYQLLFGRESIIYISPAHIGWIRNIPFLLYYAEGERTAYWLIGSVMTIAIFNFLIPRVYFLTDFAAWILMLNLHNRVYPTLSGGDYLLNQLLLFNCLLAGRAFKPWLAMLLHNLGVVAIMAQVILVYLVSSLAKLNDPLWRSGEAIALIGQLEHFWWRPVTAIPFIAPLFAPLAWGVMLYQLLFPVVMMIKKFKKPFLLAGIFMHLYIILAMGLVTFGVTMLICYLFFWPEGNRQE
jgi:hypothetical protein